MTGRQRLMAERICGYFLRRFIPAHVGHIPRDPPGSDMPGDHDCWVETVIRGAGDERRLGSRLLDLETEGFADDWYGDGSEYSLASLLDGYRPVYRLEFVPLSDGRTRIGWAFPTCFDRVGPDGWLITVPPGDFERVFGE
jgi:hypothetical protein